jgi:hypothetical protein
MSSTRPNLEGLFNGSAPAESQLTWLNGKPAGPPPVADPPAATPPAATPQAAGLLDPVAIMERYFAMLQTLLDLQRDFGLRLAHQVAELPPMNRFRR